MEVEERPQARQKLLPLQDLIFNDETTKAFSIVGGVGSGKTYAECSWLHNKAVRHPGGNFWFCSRTMKTAKDPGVKTYLDLLKHWGYVENKHFFFNKGETRLTYEWGSVVTWMSSEACKDWVGASLTAAVGDEPAYWPDHAFAELFKRLRPGPTDTEQFTRQLFLGGTPQGLGWYSDEFSGPGFESLGEDYEIELNGNRYPTAMRNEAKNRLTLHYPTFLNRELLKIDPEYINEIYDAFGHDSDMMKAHLFGLFCPLFQKTVYKMSKENECGKKSDHTASHRLDLSFDFNVGKMAWVGGQMIGGKFFFTDEADEGTAGTSEACEQIVRTYPPHLWKNHEIVIDGDCNGWSGDTRGDTTDYDIIRKELGRHYNRVVINAGHSNPSVRSRVHATNKALCKNESTGKQIEVYIGEDCPYTRDAFYRTIYTEKGNDIYKPSDDKVTHRSDAASYKTEVLFPFQSVGTIGMNW